MVAVDTGKGKKHDTDPAADGKKKTTVDIAMGSGKGKIQEAATEIHDLLRRSQGDGAPLPHYTKRFFGPECHDDEPASYEEGFEGDWEDPASYEDPSNGHAELAAWMARSYQTYGSGPEPVWENWEKRRAAEDHKQDATFFPKASGPSSSSAGAQKRDSKGKFVAKGKFVERDPDTGKDKATGKRKVEQRPKGNPEKGTDDPDTGKGKAADTRKVDQRPQSDPGTGKGEAAGKRKVKQRRNDDPDTGKGKSAGKGKVNRRRKKANVDQVDSDKGTKRYEGCSLSGREAAVEKCDLYIIISDSSEGDSDSSGSDSD